MDAHLKETVLWGTITWSEMGKQNIQGKKVYCFCDRYKKHAGQLLANFSSDPSNSPITLCERQLDPVPSSFLRWRLRKRSKAPVSQLTDELAETVQ